MPASATKGVGIIELKLPRALRGAEALTALVLQSYSNQDAELLRQPALLDHFDKRLGGMSNDLRTNPMIVKMREGIQKIRPLVVSEDAQISRNRKGNRDRFRRSS